MAIPWYKRYDELSLAVKERRSEYQARCAILGADPQSVLGEVWEELVARAVKESNWQEGLELSEPRTRELVAEVVPALTAHSGLRINTDAILAQHRRGVAKMQQEGATAEEIGAFNLSAAYYSLPLIGIELQSRQAASLAKALLELSEEIDEDVSSLPEEAQRAIKKGLDIVGSLRASGGPTLHPLTRQVDSEGEYVSELLKEDIESLMHPMPPAYIHFLHRLTLAGLYPNAVAGKYRKEPVHVGDPDVMFPTASLVPGLMREFCSWFPSLLSNVTKYDPIVMAARVSYRFVAIHPYRDGNGRVSRLLMNLVLWAHHYPPVYLKADKKGRHKYARSLKYANRGDTMPLAALIATSLEEIYSRLLLTVSRDGDPN